MRFVAVAFMRAQAVVVLEATMFTFHPGARKVLQNFVRCTRKELITAAQRFGTVEQAGKWSDPGPSKAELSRSSLSADPPKTLSVCATGKTERHQQSAVCKVVSEHLIYTTGWCAHAHAVTASERLQFFAPSSNADGQKVLRRGW